MRFIVALMLTVAFYAHPDVSYAQSTALEGVWSGSGYIKPKSGEREKVHCRISYDKETSTVYRAVATCASTAAKITQSGSILKVNANRYIGDFYNSEYDVSGRIRVIIRGSRQTVTMTSNEGSGRIKLKKMR